MNTQEKIIIWANDRNIVKKENAPKQLLKLTEEVGELAGAFVKNKEEEIIDAIGDCTVVLIILCAQLNLNFDDCLDKAFNVIKDRKGKTENGVFIRETE